MIVYFCVINLIGFIIMGVDKYKAKNKKWRIAEKTIFMIALFLGATGVWLGMLKFRHKTKHWYFKYGIPFIAMLQYFLVYEYFTNHNF